MISAITITGIKYELDDKTRKYVERKIGRLDRFLPRHARKSVTVDVKLRKVNRKFDNKYEVEVIMDLPDKKTITAKDTSLNMLAAIDIVEAKLVNQLNRYKTERLPHVGRRRLLARFKRGPGGESS